MSSLLLTFICSYAYDKINLVIITFSSFFLNNDSDDYYGSVYADEGAGNYDDLGKHTQ